MTERTCEAEGAAGEADALVSRAGEPRSAGRPRRLAVAAALAGACGAGLLARGSARPCVGTPKSFEALVAENSAEFPELSRIAAGGPSLAEWLAAASRASGAAGNGLGGASRAELARRADESIREALSSKDPKKARLLLERAVGNAVTRDRAKRKELLAYFNEAHGVVGKPGAFRGGKLPPFNVSMVKAKVDAAVAEATASSPTKFAQQISAAFCAFDVLQLATNLAALASNVNDVAKTCNNVELMDLVHIVPEETHKRACGINLAAMAGNFASIMTFVAVSASDCAVTAVPNVDALCSGAITGLMTSVSSIGGAATLIASACRKRGWYRLVPQGVVPSNVGARRLDAGAATEDASEAEPAAAAPAPERKLLYGGGKDSLATQCATQIAYVAWSLASVGLHLNLATNKEMASCPPTNSANDTDQDRLSVATCTAEVTGVLTAVMAIIAYLQMIAVTCTDDLNLEAICGAGITGVFAGATGIAQSATGVYLVCDVGQRPVLRDLLTHSLEGTNATYGRRLVEERRMTELKSRHGTPAGVWKELGFDLDDPDASWRSRFRAQVPRDENLQNFV